MKTTVSYNPKLSFILALSLTRISRCLLLISMRLYESSVTFNSALFLLQPPPPSPVLNFFLPSYPADLRYMSEAYHSRGPRCHPRRVSLARLPSLLQVGSHTLRGFTGFLHLSLLGFPCLKLSKRFHVL